MKTIHLDTGVGAPAKIVWAVVDDLDNWQRWNPVMRGEGSFELGARPQITIASPGADPLEMQPLIVHREEGKEVRWRRKLFIPGLFDAEFGMRVVSEDVGRCRFEQFGIFSGLFSNAIIARKSKAFEMAFQAMGRSLKREAERQAREQA